MKGHARVAVIGGGVVGCSVLYHLTKLGWSDVVLLERAELTSGSTWHAAGGMHTLNGDPNMARLQGYTIRLYDEIEEASGQSCGIHRAGTLYLASTPERMDFLKALHAKCRVLGLSSELVGLDELARINPLLERSHFLGAMFDPEDGHVDPSGVTNAYAAAARKAGAEVCRHTPVEALTANPDGSWTLDTPAGRLTAEIVVNAAGLWGREVAALAGYRLPIVPLEHQYLVTEPIPEVAALEREVPMTIDFEGESYLRQEGQGLLIGTYEWDCRHWAADGTPPDFGHELLPDDLDRIGERLAVAHERIPCLAEAGIRRVINGAMIFAPDGNPVIGPVPGLRNHFVAGGVMAGFSQGGGVGLALAEWIVEGEPSMDVFAMDVARFGDWCTDAYVLEKTRENYRRRFAVVFPNEELPAGRPLVTTPLHEPLTRRNAVWGQAFGLEHALWFAPEGATPEETRSFRRSNAHDPVAAECRAVREAVGLLEIANFAKYEVSGPGAEAWLGRLLAGRLPAEGRIALNPMLSQKGRLMGDLSVARLAPDRFLIVGSGAAEAFHLRWFRAHLPGHGVSLRSLTAELAGLALAGPNARAVLARLAGGDVGGDSFPFFAIREITVADRPAIVARVSYTGELGFELYLAREHQRAVFEAVLEAGDGLGLRLFGARALNALRLEKGFGAWLREYSPDYTSFESDLHRLIDFAREEFTGRDAALRQREAAPGRRLALLSVDALDADAFGDEPVLLDGEVVGVVTSGGYGHHVGRSLALAYLRPDCADPALPLMLPILGETRPARVLPRPPHDPDGSRMRE